MLNIDPHWPASHTKALHWAAGRMAAERAEPIAHSGWSSTYCLVGPKGKAYLKLLPQVQRHQIAATLAVARRFRAQVPAIIGAEPEQGWLLVTDHQGVDADSAEDHDKAAQAYGRLQGKALQDRQLLAHFEVVDLDRLWPDLRDFLARPLVADARPGEPVGGAYFMGPEDAARYLRLLERRAERLQSLIARAHRLPGTLDHGDLNAGNLAIRPDGKPVFIDWDDAFVGPAGMSLHSLFSGCVLPIMQLQRMADGQPPTDEQVARRLLAYLKGLESVGYADRATLLASVPGAICAGVLRFVAHFGRFPGEGQRAAAGRTMRRRLSGLLDLADWLASREPATALADADDYERDQEWPRAMRLVQDVLARAPQTPALLTRYGTLALRQADLDTAREALGEALQLDPAHLDASLALARLHMTRGDLGHAKAVVVEALAEQPGSEAARALRARIDEFERVRVAARAPAGLGRIRVTAQERRQGHLEPETLALVIEQFDRYGAVQLDEVFDPAFVARLQAHFEQKYGRHFHDGHHPHALRTGDKRYMLTLELDEALGDPALVASGLLLPFVRSRLGDDCVMTTYTAVISLPGAQDQLMHKDFSPLFREKGWKLNVPCWSLQAIVPLVPMNEATGGTAIWKGTQRMGERRSRRQTDVHVPQVPLGSVLLVDYKTAHAGRANRGDHVRPIVCLAYARPWFRDSINHRKQPPMRFQPGYVATAPKRVLDLVGWWQRDLELAQVDV
ncbi:MAG: phytanoyl-CoA dioxygenase family protein [Betaproteobacteria bacterium]|nr:phytanoyl-CoA dioxygenase family protein [Betaproteobacteria bacterium]